MWCFATRSESYEGGHKKAAVVVIQSFETIKNASEEEEEEEEAQDIFFLVFPDCFLFVAFTGFTKTDSLVSFESQTESYSSCHHEAKQEKHRLGCGGKYSWKG